MIISMMESVVMIINQNLELNTIINTITMVMIIKDMIITIMMDMIMQDMIMEDMITEDITMKI